MGYQYVCVQLNLRSTLNYFIKNCLDIDILDGKLLKYWIKMFDFINGLTMIKVYNIYNAIYSKEYMKKESTFYI